MATESGDGCWKRKHGECRTRNTLSNSRKRKKSIHSADLSGLEYAPPRPPHDIRAFESYPTVNDEVAYVRKGAPDSANPAFTDVGKMIEMHDTQPDSTLAALQLAQQKWGQVHVDGSEEFKTECIKLAVKNGIEISNPELQDHVELERRRLAIAQNAPVLPAPDDFEIRAEANAQAHDLAPAPGQDRDQAKDQVAELERQRRNQLIGEFDALAKLEMPVSERMSRTKAITEQITLVDAQLDRLAPPEVAPAKTEPMAPECREPQTAAD